MSVAIDGVNIGLHVTENDMYIIRTPGSNLLRLVSSKFLLRFFDSFEKFCCLQLVGIGRVKSVQIHRREIKPCCRGVSENGVVTAIENGGFKVVMTVSTESRDQGNAF
jgi:hypothetical protein